MRYTIGMRILIIAGPNGAGKTTFANEFLLNEAGCDIFLNADLIASGLDPFHPERKAIQAGRLMLSMMRDYVERGETFAFETTLSGRGYARLIPQWREMGYDVEIHYLRLPVAEYAVQRVGQRVRQGGHDIPEDAIRRRFDSGWRNFQEIYRDLVDEWAVYDSTTTPPTLIERGGI